MPAGPAGIENASVDAIDGRRPIEFRFCSDMHKKFCASIALTHDAESDPEDFDHGKVSTEFLLVPELGYLTVSIGYEDTGGKTYPAVPYRLHRPKVLVGEDWSGRVW